MKLTCFLLLSFFLQGTAATMGQAITLKKGKITYGQLFREIQQQTGYDVLLRTSNFNLEKKIDVNFQNSSLNKVLNWIRYSENIEYSLHGKSIILNAHTHTTGATESPQLNLRGKVIDRNGKPLSGVSIKVKDKIIQGASNNEGEFSLNAVDANDILTVTMLGFKSQVISINGKSFITIVLEESNTEIDEVAVVNTGYQTLSRERATGSYDVVDQKVLSKRPGADLSSALQGLVAGMQGKENADGTVSFLVRGNSSLYANRNPLIVVDGVPLSNSDFSTINPNDVESVTVLKDAAAASIWGARSGNGVIVVSTKKGKAERGLSIDASFFTRIGLRPNLKQLLSNASSADQVRFEKLAFENKWTFAGLQYQGGVFPSDAGNSLTLAQELMYENQYGRLSTEEMNLGLDRLSSINNSGQLQQYLLRSSMLNQYNVSLSQASHKVQNYASILYESNDSQFQKSGSERFALNFNNEYRPSNFIKFNLGLYLQYVDQEASGTTIDELQSLSPYELLINENGSYAPNINNRNRSLLSSISNNGFPYSDWSYNLLREVRGRELESKNYNARIQTGVNIKILEGLSYDAKFQFERGRTDVHNFYSDETFYVRNMANTFVEYNNQSKTVGRKFIPNGGIGQPSQTDLNSYLLRSQLNYQKDFGADHSITAIGGLEISQMKRDGITRPWLYGYFPDLLRTSTPLYGYGSSVELFPAFTTGSVANQTLSGGNSTITYSLDRFVSYFGNAAYTYLGKYTVTGSVRADASNFIADDPSIRWSPMWSVGGLWNMKKEGFFANIDWLSQLRLRSTYGKNGNVEKSTSTKTLLNVGSALNVNTGTITATISSYGNPLLSWEKTTTTNVGVDFSVLSGRLFGKVDYYNKKGKDITGNIALPASAGTTSQRFNNASIINNGIELELGAQLRKSETGIGYVSSFTYAYNKNKVLSLRSPVQYPYVLVFPEQAFVEGYPINPMFSYNYVGMENGIPMVESGNGLTAGMNTTLYVTGDPLSILKYQGTNTPPHTLGWFNTLDYKNFSLTMLFVGKFGGVYRNPTFDYSTAYVGSSKVVINQFVRDVFDGRSDIPSFPAPNESRHYTWTQYTDYLSSLVESSSYIEAKEVSLSYSLPQSILSKYKTRNLRLYAQVRDLGLVWSANKNDYNPDWLPGTTRPMTSFTFGLNIGF